MFVAPLNTNHGDVNGWPHITPEEGSDHKPPSSPDRNFVVIQDRHNTQSLFTTVSQQYQHQTPQNSIQRNRLLAKPYTVKNYHPHNTPNPYPEESKPQNSPPKQGTPPSKSARRRQHPKPYLNPPRPPTPTHLLHSTASPQNPTQEAVKNLSQTPAHATNKTISSNRRRKGGWVRHASASRNGSLLHVAKKEFMSCQFSLSQMTETGYMHDSPYLPRLRFHQ